MKEAICLLESAAVYSQNRAIRSTKEPRELDKDFEERTWKERCWVDETGHLFIPPMAFKSAIAAYAKYISEKIPGKRNATYTKHFVSGILINEGIGLTETLDTVQNEFLMVPSNGVSGSSSKVWKRFPIIPRWKGELRVYILDEIITESVFREHLIGAGLLIGIGRWRPERQGLNGRFSVKKVTWKDFSIDSLVEKAA